jgi:hypothetical protein
LREAPSLQGFLEETLLSLPDELGDFVVRFVEQWREQIEAYLQYVDNGAAERERMLTELTQQVEFWEVFKDISTAFNKV